ncbi:DUF4937 domain-containing protein [Paenibacillus sp. S-38]|uniref:DUF4937 domain-containing protein n=1 Tax=Paenibacillus sp. S-38 TaxID=3416710 RepID=UPI003CF5B1F6
MSCYCYVIHKQGGIDTLIKCIKCRVPENVKPLFHQAQQQWNRLSNEQGFYLQVGGWNLSDSSEAIIIGMWVSPKEYYRLMDEFHDTVLTNSEQQRYYEEIDVKLWNTACVEKLTSIGDTIELFATRPECSNVSECTLIELEAVGTSK